MRRFLWIFSALSLILPFSPNSYAQERPISKLYDLHLSKGIIELDAERYEAARAEFERALRERPDEPEANYLMGLTLLHLKDIKGAEGRFKKVLERDPSYPGLHFQLGVLYFERESYNEALKEFMEAGKSEPGQAMVYYYRGLIHYRLGEHDRAPAQFLKAISLDPALSLVSHYYSGLSYYKEGIFEEAKEAFEEVIRLDPRSDLAVSAQEYLNELKKVPKAQKKWDLSLSLGVQLDSNVILEPSDSRAAAEIADEEDTRYLIYFTGGYRLSDREPWHVGTGYSFYQSIHQDLEEFDTTSHDLRVYGWYNRERYQARLHYNYNYILVGDNKYLSLHGVNPLLNILWEKKQMTQLQYRFQSKDFLDSDQFPANSQRDGNNHLIGLTQFYFFAKEGNLRTGYSYDRDSTDGEDWDYQGHRLFVGLGLPPVIGVKLDLIAEFYPRAYENPHSLSPEGDKRDDRYQAYTLALTRDFTKHLALSFQYLYSKNDSNLPIFEYDRTIYSFTITGRI